MNKNNSLDKVVSQVDHLTPEELLYLKQAMDNPELVNALWASDYEEIPVDIETFITDKRYLGSSFTDDEGKSLIYKFWRDELKNNIFNPEKPKWEVAFSGSIGSGKSTVADICMAYILYKLLCLRDPAAYYRLAKGSRIALVFFNIGMDQAYSVGYGKFQSYLKASPWFLEHGKIYGREGYETYYPGKDIRIIVASRSEHIIGTDVFCLTGDTLIETENGPIEIRQLQNNPMKVYNSGGMLSDFPVYSVETMKTFDLIEIELENGEVVRCTPNHRFMLKDGTFKEAQDLTEDDELKEI